MRILFVHDFYQQYGGEDEAALADKKLLEERQEKIVLYTRYNDEIKNYSVVEKALFFPRTIYSRKTVRDVRRLLQRERPELAYVHNVFPLISPSLYYALHSLRIPCIQVFHDYRFLCINGWFYTQGQICERCKWGNYLHGIRYKCMRNSRALSALYAVALGFNRASGALRKLNFVATTAFSKQKLMEVGVPEERVFIKPHFIEANAVCPDYRTGDYVAFLGRVSAEKGVWTLVKAFERMREINLKIIGTGPLEGALRGYISERGMSNVQLVGFKTGTEKWDLLKGSMFSVFPSTSYETFGKAVVEAYAAGKCVIGSNLGGIPYVIEDGKSGLLSEPASVGDLVEKVRFLADRPAEIDRMGRYGRRLAETRYSPDENYRALRRIFESVLAERTGNGLGGA